jgi:multidrug efflux pump subunit AcrA (membrane-fusion protein)
MKNFSLMIAALILMTTSGCNGRKEKPEQQEKIIPVKVMEVSASTSANVRNYVGTIEESQAISLSFSGMGTVEQVFVAENEISSTHRGQKAVIEVAALNNETFEGEIETKGISANLLSHSYEVKIAINNTDAKLLPGMVCKIRLAQDDATTEIVVPNGTVQIAPDGKRFVWLAVETQGTASLQAKRRFVTTGK